MSTVTDDAEALPLLALMLLMLQSICCGFAGKSADVQHCVAAAMTDPTLLSQERARMLAVAKMMVAAHFQSQNVQCRPAILKLDLNQRPDG